MPSSVDRSVRSNPRVVVRANGAVDIGATRRLLVAPILARGHVDLAGLFVVISAGSIVGCGGLEPCGRASILHTQVVEKTARRRGVGRRLVSTIIVVAARRRAGGDADERCSGT
jgi:hypothetical protein